MKKFLYLLLLVTAFLVSPLITEASTGAAVTEAAYETWKKANYGDAMNAPVDLQESTLHINGSNGRATLREVDLTLPGRNGMDVNIIRTYDSMPNVTYDTTTSSSNTSTKVLRMRYKNAAGEKRLVDFLSEDDYFKYDNGNGIYVLFSATQTLYDQIVRTNGTLVTRDTTYTPTWVNVTFSDIRNHFDMEMRGGQEITENWYAELPQLTTLFSIAGDLGEIKFFQELHFPDGRAYALRHTYTPASNSDTLSRYTGTFTDSVDFKILHPYAGAVNGDTEDTEKGIWYGFKFQDKNGKIYYFNVNGQLVYEEDRFGNNIKYTYFNGGYEIRDTLGRIIRYETVNTGDTVGKVTVTADGITKTMLYYDYSVEEKDVFAYNDLYRLKVKKVENGETAENCTNYTTYQMAKRTNMYDYKDQQYYKYTYPTMLLQKIIKPNGCYSSFEYTTRKLGIGNEYVVNKTVDVQLNGQTENQMNRWTYTYDDAFVKTRQDGYKETVHFDGSKRVKLVIKTGDGIKEEERYVYDANRADKQKPSDILYQKYTQIFNHASEDNYDFIELVANYEADDRENRIYENDMGKVVRCDYGTEETNPYNFMLSKTYENDGQEIKIENVLTSDLKNIAQTKEYVMENGTWVEKNIVTYEYDSYGNVIKETKRPSAGETIETHITYTYSGAAYTVESYIMDENNERVSTINQYDAFGRLTETTDANGNETTYSYDDLARLTLITYADGTTRSYSYDEANNSITAINENGTEIRQTYNIYGKEKKTEVKNEQGVYVTLQSNAYFVADGSLASVTEIGPGNKRVKTEYTWDDAGNVKSKIVKEEDASGNFVETDRITATYTAPAETGTRMRRDGVSTQTTNKITNWHGELKYERNGETSTSSKTYVLNSQYDYALMNMSFTSGKSARIRIYRGSSYEEFAHKSCIDKEVEPSKYYRSFIIPVTGVTKVVILGPSSSSAPDIYNFRAYTKEDIDELVTKVQTTQTGDSTITPPKTETRIDIWGNVVYNKLTDASTGDVLAEEFSRFDDLGNEIAYRNPVSYDLGQDTVSRTYNYRGQVLTETTNDSVLGTSTQSVAYDNIGRVISETDANGNTTNYTYDKLGRVIRKTYPVDNSQTGEIRYTYDKNGNVTKEEVKNGNTYDTVEYVYDSKNRVIRMTAYPEANKPQITQYYYDNTGNVLRMYTGLSAPLTIHGLDNVTANGDSDYHVTKYTYNFMGYPVKMTDSLGQDETYTVDYLGNVLSKTDRNGDTVTTTYNYMGLPLSVTASNGNKTITYTYDKLGNRTKMVDETGTTNYTYSDLSQLTGETKGNISKTYTYDKNGSRTGFTLKEGTTTHLSNTYTVGSTGIMSAMTSGTDSVAYTYDNNRNMLTETINGTLSQTNQYNKANQATVVQNKNGTSLHSQFAYTYSTNGNMLTIWEQLGSAGVEGREFEYDGMGRLKSEVLGSDLLSYSYDDFSNRAAMTKQNKTTSFVHDANNRLTGSTHPDTQTTYSYDDNGSLTSETATGTDATNGTYTYDGLGRLTSLTKDGKTVSYAYNGDGQRVSKTVNGTTTQYVWDGDYIVMEKTGNSVTVYKRAQNLFASEKDGTKTFYCYNVRGDVVQLTNASYTVTKTYRYDAFGNEQNPDANDTNPFRYCGEYFDAETGYIYLRARYYDPAVGRFISEDPIRDGLNWYVYCGNNPVDYIDPSGLSGIKKDGTYHITHPLDRELLQLKQEYVTATPERQAQIAAEAKNIRASGEINVDWSVQADRSLDYYMIDTDVTEKLNSIIKSSESKNWWKRFLKFIPGTVTTIYTDFALMVMPGGKYDLKSKKEWQGKEHYIYEGEIVWFDAPGNILYGYLGKVMGFDDTILKAAGGAVQILQDRSSIEFASSYFDDPRDTEAIQKGIDKFKITHSRIWW